MHNQDILLDLANFALQEETEDNLMVAISRTWYNGSYAVAAYPIKSLELHYTVIQYLILCNVAGPPVLLFYNQTSVEYTLFQNDNHFNILLFTFKLALLASFKIKYSFDF